MSIDTVTFANTFGEMIGPLLIAIRSTGFFEAYVFIPIMTTLSVFLFIKIWPRLHSNGSFDNRWRRTMKYPFLFLSYFMCFLVCNAFAVATKTLIIEETDYETPVWFIGLVGPGHYYLVTVAGAALWLYVRNSQKMLDGALALHVQIGLGFGYWIAIYRIFNEPFSLNDVTTGMSGYLLLIWFSLMNWDLFLRSQSKTHDERRMLSTA